MLMWIKKRCRRQQSSPYGVKLEKFRKLQSPRQQRPRSTGNDVTLPFYFELEEKLRQRNHFYEEIKEHPGSYAVNNSPRRVTPLRNGHGSTSCIDRRSLRRVASLRRDLRSTPRAVYASPRRVVSLLDETEVDFSCLLDVCVTCRKNFNVSGNRDSICSCYAEPINISYQPSPAFSRSQDMTSYSRSYRQDVMSSSRSYRQENISSRSHGQMSNGLDVYDSLRTHYRDNRDYSSLNDVKRRHLFRSRSDIRRRPLPELPVYNEIESESDSSGFYECIDTDEEEIRVIGPYISDPVIV